MAEGPRIGYGYAVRRVMMDEMREFAISGDVSVATIDRAMSHIQGTKSRSHVVSVLRRIWTNPLLDHPLTREILADPRQRLDLYWGLLVSAFPFVALTTRLIGMDLRLGNPVTSKSVLTKVIRHVGHTRRVEIAVQAVLTTLVDWELLARVKTGTYGPVPKRLVTHSHLLQWFALVALTVERQDRLALSHIEQLPWLFPFAMDLSRQAFRGSSWFLLEQQGMHEMVVGLVQPVPLAK
ncbi:MAG: hypothetical protein OWQ57_02895 [Sulfobacillus sp.]|nr:hypothetical protein [Sulfobacillus sp.]